MTSPREIIAGLLRQEFGPHADRVAIDDFFRNVAASGLHILSDADLQARDDAVLEKARRATRNAVLNIPATDRMNGDILDEALFIALHSLKGGKP